MAGRRDVRIVRSSAEERPFTSDYEVQNIQSNNSKGRYKLSDLASGKCEDAST